MPLNKATKTVLFSDGMGDDSDRFLLEPPSIDYAENLRIDKTGSLQKRPGFGPDALASVPNANGDPFFIHGMGDNLHVITEDGARTWDGNTSTWRETDAAGFVATSSVVAESQSFVGLGNCAYLPFLHYQTGAIEGHAIAYEVREENSDTDYTVESAKHVVFQRYEADGTFLDQRRYDGARSPRLVQGPAGFVSMFYQDIATGELGFIEAQISLPVGIPRTPTMLSGLVPSTYPRMQHYSPLDQGPRLGQGVYGQARYLVEYSEDVNKFYILYTHDASTGVFMREIDEGGQITGSATLRNNDDCDILALHVSSVGVFALWQYWDTKEEVSINTPVGSGLWLLHLNVYPIGNINDGPTLAQHTMDGGTSHVVSDMFTHGTIATDMSTGSVMIFLAVHYSGKNSRSMANVNNPPLDPDYIGQAHFWYPWNLRAGDTRLRTWEFSLGQSPSIMNASLHAHRLTTNAIRHDGKWYAGVQQWLDYTPIHINPGGINRYVNVDAAVKPVTTSLCVFTRDEPVRPVATLDAGMSGHVDYAESEVAIHLGTLTADGDDLLVSNRVKLRAEDCSFYFGARDSVWRRTSNVEVGSDSLCRVHRVKKAGQEFTVAPFGDGLALSTAVPMWFDGNFFGEFGPLDSPEIMRVEDADYSNDTVGRPGSDAMYSAPCQGYEEMPGEESIIYRKFSAIVGYMDSRGNRHRSAPSATYFVGDVEENRESTVDGEWSGRDVTIWVTTPLSVLPEDIEYFVEIYVSTDVDTDMQLAAQASIDMRSTGNYTHLTFQLNRAVESDKGLTKPLLRSTAPVYTSGGVLAAEPWPASGHSVVQSTRFWALDATNKGRVLYSKLFEDFIAPEYNPTLSINLGDERDLTAIGKLDDKVVIFEPDDIHVIYGEGPDNRGQGKDFAVHYISTDVGCTDQESIIETPVGLIFYSEPRGFYLLDRNLQVQFIGGGIEDTARGINIVAATLVRDRAEVRFAYSGGPGQWDRLGPSADTTAVDRPPRPVFTNAGAVFDPALTYNYERNAWMTYSNYDAQASTVYQGKYTMLRSDWTIWQEKEERWDDPEGYNLTIFTTPWIKLSENIQDFNRLWSMTVIGRYLSSLQDLGNEEYEAGDVRLRIYYDYEAEPTQQKQFAVQDFGYDPFNNPPKRAERFQFEIVPKRGRCQSVKLEISEQNSQDQGEGLTYKQGRGFEIVSVDFHVGLGPSRTLIQQAVKK